MSSKQYLPIVNKGGISFVSLCVPCMLHLKWQRVPPVKSVVQAIVSVAIGHMHNNNNYCKNEYLKQEQAKKLSFELN